MTGVDKVDAESLPGASREAGDIQAFDGGKGGREERTQQKCDPLQNIACKGYNSRLHSLFVRIVIAAESEEREQCSADQGIAAVRWETGKNKYQYQLSKRQTVHP